MMDLPLIAWKPAITSSMLALFQLTVTRGTWPPCTRTTGIASAGAAATTGGGADSADGAVTPPVHATKVCAVPKETRIASAVRSTR